MLIERERVAGSRVATGEGRAPTATRCCHVGTLAGRRQQAAGGVSVGWLVGSPYTNQSKAEQRARTLRAFVHAPLDLSAWLHLACWRRSSSHVSHTAASLLPLQQQPGRPEKSLVSLSSRSVLCQLYNRFESLVVSWWLWCPACVGEPSSASAAAPAPSPCPPSPLSLRLSACSCLTSRQWLR